MSKLLFHTKCRSVARTAALAASWARAPWQACRVFVALIALGTAGPSAQAQGVLEEGGKSSQVPAPKVKTADSFGEIRSEVLNSIGAASQRIWLVTEFLTDGEIASALYVAQYRKVDVQVLLGKAKSAHYLSRLSYLKNQNIPVFLRPDSWRPPSVTAILTDQKVWLIDGELDSLSHVKRFNIQQGSPSEAAQFAQGFAQAANLKVPALPRPLPLVGRAKGMRGGWGKAYVPENSGSHPVGATSRLMPSAPRYESGSDSFIYDRRPTPRPDGVPAKLPKALKWERRTKDSKPAPNAPGEARPEISDDLELREGEGG